MSKRWQHVRHLIVHNILHADDTPHSIAMGASIAMFIAILPLFGLQTVVSVALAALFRVNKAICVPIVWVSNPFTCIPLIGGSYAIGRFIMNSGEPAHTTEALAAQLIEPVKQATWVQPQYWYDLLSTLYGLGIDLWVGSAVLGLVFAIITYPVIRWFVAVHRERRRKHLLQQQVFQVPALSGAAAPRKSEVA